MQTEKLSKGVSFCYEKTDKFKTSALSFSFISPLGSTAAADSLIIHLLSRTNAQYPTVSAMNRKLASLYGATLTASVSKSGDNLLLRLNMTSVDDRFSLNNESICEESIKLLCSCVFRPSVTMEGFKKEDVEREKRLLKEKIESKKNDKRNYALTRMIEEMCKCETYGLPKYGTKKEIDALSEKELFSRWLKLVVNCPVQINYVGSADSEKIKAVILSYFDQIGRKAVWPIKTEFVVDAYDKNLITEKQAVKQGKLVIGYRAGMSYDRDNYPAVKLMTMIFGGGTFSKLFTNVREKMSLCYYCSARLIDQKGLIVVESGVETKNAQKALVAIRNELSALQKGNFTKEDLESAKLSLCDALKGVYDSSQGINSWLLSYSLNSVFYTPEELAELIKKVSFEEIVVAANMIDEDTVYILEAEEGDA